MSRGLISIGLQNTLSSPGKAVYAITEGFLQDKTFLAFPEDPAQAARGQLQRQDTQSAKFWNLHLQLKNQKFQGQYFGAIYNRTAVGVTEKCWQKHYLQHLSA